MYTTVQVKGIVWQARRYEGKLAFSFQSVAVFYNAETAQHEAWSLGKLIYATKHIGDCLEVITPVVLDALANQFIPSWDEGYSYDITELDPCEVKFDVAA